MSSNWLTDSRTVVNSRRSARLQRDVPAAWHLLQMFKATPSQIFRLLRLHPTANNGSVSVTAAACTWLQQQPNMWNSSVVTAQSEAVALEAVRVRLANQKVNISLGVLVAPRWRASGSDDAEVAAFRLAVDQVNADSTLLPRIHLKAVMMDTTRLRLLSKDTSAYFLVWLRLVCFCTLAPRRTCVRTCHRAYKQTIACCSIGAGSMLNT